MGSDQRIPQRDDLPVFDVHTHAFPDPLAISAIPKLEAGGKWEEVKAYHDGTVSGLLASMDRAGVDRAIICSVATRPAQTPKITDWSGEIASERLVPFTSVHPDVADPEAEVARAVEAGLAGLKFHPQYMNCPPDDPRAIRIAQAAADADLAMLFHAGYDVAYERDGLAGPLRMRRLHEAVPELRFIAAHMGGWQRWEEVLEHLAGLPVYLETSYTFGRCPDDLLARLFDDHDDAYLLWGTDSPWADQRAELEAMLALPLAEGLKRRMLWDNAFAFLGWDVPAVGR